MCVTSPKIGSNQIRIAARFLLAFQLGSSEVSAMTSPVGTPRMMPMDIGVAPGLNEGNVDEQPSSSIPLPDSPETAQQEMDL